MNLIWFFLIPFFCWAQLERPTRADDITYEWLIQANLEPCETHHVALFKQIFDSKKIKSLLEFGLGYPTKFFLDHCNKVISVEIITHGYGPDVMRQFLGMYSDYSNWIPIAFFSGYRGCDYSWATYKYLGSESVYKATSYQHAYQKSYIPIDDFYLTELEAFTKNLLKYNRVEVAFIGNAIILRGDLVQLLFDKVPVIIAHNTALRMQKVGTDIYGLIHIKTPDNYEEIFFPLKGGTTAWIEKKETYRELIEKLKEFAKGLSL